MKFKTLLLGSAAAVAVTGAQAADLQVAAPVDYVRVCDAFGVGYHYIPGTDTCLKFGGRARFEVFAFDKRGIDPYVTASASVFQTTVDVLSGGATVGSFVISQSGEVDVARSHDANWSFVSSAMLNFTAKSMTEHGVLTGYIEFVAASNNVLANSYFSLDKAYVELGPLLVGRNTSLYEGYGAYTFAGELDNGDRSSDQVRLSWAMSGFGLAVSLEDPRDHLSSQVGDYDIPAVIGAISYDVGSVKTKLVGAYGRGSWGSAWGVHANLELGLGEYINGGGIRFRVGYGDSSGIASSPWLGGLAGAGSGWNAMTSAKWAWAPGITSAVTFAYVNYSGYGTNWAGAANVVWEPYTGFLTGVEVVYVDKTAGAVRPGWSGRWRTQRTW